MIGSSKITTIEPQQTMGIPQHGNWTLKYRHCQSANCVTGLWTPSSYQGHSVWLRSTPGSVSVSLSSLRGHPQGTVSHSILCPHSLTLNSSVFTGEWEQWRIFLVLFDNFHLVAFLKSISFIINGWVDRSNLIFFITNFRLDTFNVKCKGFH